MKPENKLLRHIDVGGKVVRLVEDDNFYYMYEGKTLVYTFVKAKVQRKTAWYITTDYVKYLKEVQKQFVDGDFPIDKLVAEVEETMRLQFEKRLKQFFKKMSQKNVQKKTESFFKIDILGKLKDVFSGFNADINKMVTDTLNKLNVQVVDDVTDTGINTPNVVAKKILDKKALMKKNIADSIKDTKDKILKDIKKDLTQGIVAGVDAKTLQKDIEKKFDYKNGVAWKTKRSIGGAMRMANTTLQFKKWLEMGFTQFEWISREDSKVRHSHSLKNRHVYDIREALDDVSNWDAFPGKAANCRCTAVLYD